MEAGMRGGPVFTLTRAEGIPTTGAEGIPQRGGAAVQKCTFACLPGFAYRFLYTFRKLLQSCITAHGRSSPQFSALRPDGPSETLLHSARGAVQGCVEPRPFRWGRNGAQKRSGHA